MTPSLADFQQRLATFLSDAAGCTVTVEAAERLAGGASREMWAVQTIMDGTPQKFVLRRDLPTTMYSDALTRAQEFAVMSRAAEVGIKAATPRFLCTDPGVLGAPFFVMDFVEGIAIGRKIVTAPELASARAALPEQMAAQLACIHALNVDDLDFLRRPADGKSPAQQAIDETYATLDQLGIHSPAFEFALRWVSRWVAQNMPNPVPLTFCHGDFRVGNLIVDQDGLAAIADWEFAHIGDPHSELGYLCMRDWRFGVGHLRMGGIADREPFLQAYERHLEMLGIERTVDRAAVDFWEVLGNIRWGVICLAQAERHLSGGDPSVELASLGRRSVEMQMEMLRLIERIGV